MSLNTSYGRKDVIFSCTSDIFQDSCSEILALVKQAVYVFQIMVASDHWNEIAEAPEDASH